MTRADLLHLFDPMQNTDLECDGFSRVVASILTERGHTPRLMAGLVSVRDRVVRPHFWVTIAGWTIDYQIRRWIGAESWIPHGVFVPAETEAIYEGEEVAFPVLSPAVRALMLIPNAALLYQLSPANSLAESALRLDSSLVIEKPGV